MTDPLQPPTVGAVRFSPAQEREQLKIFFMYLYGNEVGYSCISKVGPGVPWMQEFFLWPNQADEMVNYVLDMKERLNVHHSPSLFRSPSTLRSQVLGARVLYCEFDQGVPDIDNLPMGIPRPSFRLQSSYETCQHWYWYLGYMLNPDELERYNHGLAELLGADSTWNAGRVLRPPFTNHHDKMRETIVLDGSWTPVELSGFPDFAPAPNVRPAPLPDTLPDVRRVLAEHTLPQDVLDLIFQPSVEEGFRSSLEMKLGYRLAECGLSDEDMFVILFDADARWGKFRNRSDRDIRLMELLSVARAKHPYLNPDEIANVQLANGIDLSKVFASISVDELLSVEIPPDFFKWEGFLPKVGILTLAGESGTGKSSLTMDALIHLATGESFLDRSLYQCRSMYFNFEMHDMGTKKFFEKQIATRSLEDQQLIRENVRFAGHGNPSELLTNGIQKAALEYEIQVHGLNGIVLDSLGKSTQSRLGEEDIRSLMVWLNYICNKHGIFVWLIHHVRKSASGKQPTYDQARVFGSAYIMNETTTGLLLDRHPRNRNELLLTRIKGRYTEDDEEQYTLHRSTDMLYSKLSGLAKDHDKKDALPNVTLVNPQPPESGLSGTM